MNATNPSGGRRIVPSSRPSSSPCSPCSSPQDPVRWAEQERTDRAHSKSMDNRFNGQWRFGRSGRVCVVVVVVTCKGIGEKQEMHQKCNRKRNKKRQRERETINLNHSGPKKENRNKNNGNSGLNSFTEFKSFVFGVVVVGGTSSFGEHLFSNLSSSL